jgi:phage terminase large subunit
MRPGDLLIADSAEPKSVADLNSYGLTCRGAEKGDGSVRYSLSWLQHRLKIVIDPVRCPYAAQEFADYEYAMTKDGEFFSDYPDRANHAIDCTRYALSLVWRQRGK